MASMGFDGGSVLAGLLRLQQGNLEALAAAQRSALGGLAALGQHWPALPSLPAPPADPAAAIQGGVAAAKAALLEGTAEANAMVEVIGRANAEAADILQQRMLAALDEWQALLLGTLPGR